MPPNVNKATVGDQTNTLTHCSGQSLTVAVGGKEGAQPGLPESSPSLSLQDFSELWKTRDK